MPETHLAAVASAAIAGVEGTVDALDAVRALRNLQRRCQADEAGARVSFKEVQALLALVERLTARAAEPGAVAAAIRSRFDTLRMSDPQLVSHLAGTFSTPGSPAGGAATSGSKLGGVPSRLRGAPASEADVARAQTQITAAAIGSGSAGPSSGDSDVADATGTTVSGAMPVATRHVPFADKARRQPSAGPSDGGRATAAPAAAAPPATVNPATAATDVKSVSACAAAASVVAAAEAARQVLDALPAARAVLAAGPATSGGPAGTADGRHMVVGTPGPSHGSVSSVSTAVSALLLELTAWSFDIFSLAAARPHNVIETVGWAALQRHGLPASLGLDEAAVRAWLHAVEEGYSDPPYHNRVHGADVTQTTFWFTWSGTSASGKAEGGGMGHWLSEEEKLALVLGAAAHDTGHIGRNNPFLVATMHPLALRYNDRSPLENMHAARAFELMRDASMDWLAALQPAQRTAVRRDMISIILATDNAEHFNQVAALGRKIEAARARIELGEDPGSSAPATPTTASPKHASGAASQLPDLATVGGTVLDLDTDLEARLLVKGLALHAADVSNPAKRFGTAAAWADRVRAEFYEQGDEERARGLPIAAGFDRESEIPMGKFQLGFIRFIVQPLYRQINDANCDDVSGEDATPWFNVEQPLAHLDSNIAEWQARLDADAPPAEAAAAAPPAATASPPPPPPRREE